MIIALCEMLAASSWIWTRVTVSISHDNNHCTPRSQNNYIIHCDFKIHTNKTINTDWLVTGIKLRAEKPGWWQMLLYVMARSSQWICHKKIRLSVKNVELYFSILRHIIHSCCSKIKEIAVQASNPLSDVDSGVSVSLSIIETTTPISDNTPRFENHFSFFFSENYYFSFYCGLFVLILVVFLLFFSLRFGQISPLAFFRWLTATSDRNAESCNRIPSNYCLP